MSRLCRLAAGDVDGVVDVDEACHSKERVMSHIWMSHITRRNESWHTYEGVMSQIGMSHVTHVQISRRRCRRCCNRSMLHIWMSQVTRMKESCHSYEHVMSHMCRLAAGDVDGAASAKALAAREFESAQQDKVCDMGWLRIVGSLK